jgi:hypothetical protein
VASKFWAKVYIEILDDWNEETGTTENPGANPGAIGWMLIVLAVILALSTSIALVYTVAQYSDSAAAGLALIMILGWLWGLSGWGVE